jgi:acetylornithine deacetylase/succinyl-diaminopimelate desuccinylase-like protein
MATDPTFQNAVAFAQELIRIPSLPGAEGDVAARVMKEMKDLGYDEVEVDSLGNVIGLVRGGGEGPPVLMNCHMDIVAAGDPAEWEFPPFGGVVEGGFLHGRGAMDIKGPLAIQTHVAPLMRERLDGDLIVAHTVFEERGGWGMNHFLDVTPVRPGAVIIGESTHGDVTIGHRGRAEVEVVIRGLAGHASAPERARNALDPLPAVLEAVVKLSAEQASDPILGRASVVPTMVDVRPESRNVIPDEVVITLDWRESYTGLSELRDLFTPGFLMDREHPLITAAAMAVGGREDPSVPAVVRPWAFATDGGWSCGVAGIPTLGFAPGEERFAHTNRERLDLAEAEWAFGRHLGLIEAVQEALGQRS